MMKKSYVTLLLITFFNKTVLASHTSGTLTETRAQCYSQSPIDRYIIRINRITLLQQQQAESRNPAEVQAIQKEVRQLKRLTKRLEPSTIQEIADEFVAAQAPPSFDNRKYESPIPKDHPGLAYINNIIMTMKRLSPRSRLAFLKSTFTYNGVEPPILTDQEARLRLAACILNQNEVSSITEYSEEFPEISETAYFEDFGSRDSQISTVEKVIALLEARQEMIDGESPEYDRHDKAIVRLQNILEILEDEQEK